MPSQGCRPKYCTWSARALASRRNPVYMSISLPETTRSVGRMFSADLKPREAGFPSGGRFRACTRFVCFTRVRDKKTCTQILIVSMNDSIVSCYCIHPDPFWAAWEASFFCLKSVRIFEIFLLIFCNLASPAGRGAASSRLASSIMSFKILIGPG